MPVRVAVVGPGRVGTALGTLWARGGCELLGFVGRDEAAAARAVAFAGSGRVLGPADLATAACVLLAVPDAELAAAAREHAAAGAVRRCSLWLHASGASGVDVLEPLAAAGARTGSLHPPCPVPDPAAGVATLPGRPAVIAGARRSRALLAALARRAGMRPLLLETEDRALYHAACALGANGVTALCALVEETLVRLGLAAGDARAVVQSLLQPAVAGAAEHGPSAALSGPVQRGDSETVARHAAALEHAAPDAAAAYRALMAAAARLATAAGAITPGQAARIRAALAP